MSYFLYQGELNPDFTYVVTDANGAVDLTGKTVRLFTRLAGSEVLIVDNQPVTLANQVTTKGGISYAWQAGDTQQAGTILAWLTIDGQSTPEFTIPIYTHLVPWCSPGDVAGFLGITTPVDGGDLLDAAVAASEILHELSARLFNIYRDTVRPCRQGCGCWGGGSFANGIPPALLTWGAWGIGTYGWGYDGCTDTVGCSPLSEILLPGAVVQKVNQVKIDGAVLASSSYRLDEYDRLVRTDGVWWPSCQNMNLADTQNGTWSVDYTWGVSPPRIGSLAAAQLAAEFYKAFKGGACSLPLAVRSLVRQGVRIDRGSLAKMAKDGGGFGLALVDTFLTTYNPEGATEQSTVWSPDIPQDPRRVGT